MLANVEHVVVRVVAMMVEHVRIAVIDLDGGEVGDWNGEPVRQAASYDEVSGRRRAIKEGKNALDMR